MQKVIDLIIAYLVQLGENRKSKSYSIKKILEVFDYKYLSYDDIFEIAKYLESLGYVEVIYVLGDAFIKLKVLGKIYFEGKSEIEKKELKSELADLNFENKLNKIIQEYSDDSVGKSKRDIVKFISDLVKKLKSLRNWKNEGFLNDLEILKLEVEKKHPNKEIIYNKIYSLYDCIPIRSKIKELESMMNIDKINF